MSKPPALRYSWLIVYEKLRRESRPQDLVLEVS